MKHTLKKLLYPKGWVMLLLSVLCTAALVYIFIKGYDTHPVSCAVYALSAYTLTTVCIFMSKTVPDRYRKTKQLVYAHPLGNKYLTDISFKVRVSLYVSLTINIIYSVFKPISGIYYSSFWWGAAAVYYMVLSVMRFLLLRQMRKSGQDMLSEYKSYRICGILMAMLNLSLTGIVFQMVWQDKAYSYPEIIVIASAAYTFFNVAVSVKDIVKYRKYNSPVMSASKAISFAAALVSLLSLETAMLSRYGENKDFNRIMTACTGAGICIIILSVSIYMIINSCRRIKRLSD